MLKLLSDPPRIIVAKRNGAKVAQANPDAIIVDREAACIRRDLLRRSMRTERVRGLTEYILRALPKTEIDRAEALTKITKMDARNFNRCVIQVHHNLKPFGLGVKLFHGGRVVIVEQEASAC